MTTFDVTAANKVLAENFAPWVLATGIVTDGMDKTSATLRIPFSEQLTRVGGIMSGQTLVTGADTAMVIALCGAFGAFKPVTTVDLTINYMRPVTKADAVIVARIMRLGRTLAFLTTEITEKGAEKPSAFATGTYAIPA